MHGAGPRHFYVSSVTHTLHLVAVSTFTHKYRRLCVGPYCAHTDKVIFRANILKWLDTFQVCSNVNCVQIYNYRTA